MNVHFHASIDMDDSSPLGPVTYQIISDNLMEIIDVVTPKTVDGKIMTEDGTVFNVIFVGKFSGKVSHEVDKPGLKVGYKIFGFVDWDRRTPVSIITRVNIISFIFLDFIFITV